MLKGRVGLIALAVALLLLMSMAGKIHGQKSAVRGYLLPASVRPSGIAVPPKNKTNAAPAAAVPAKTRRTPRRLAEQNDPAPPFFTPGNLVVAVAGCGVYGGTPPNNPPSSATCATPPVGGTGGTTGTGPNSYGDDQGAPWNLWQYTPNGASSVTFVNSLQLPQNISGANYPVSNDYGSQSEGTIQLSGNGLFLTMMGYGLNAATFNTNYLDYCPGSTNRQPRIVHASRRTETRRWPRREPCWDKLTAETRQYHAWRR